MRSQAPRWSGSRAGTVGRWRFGVKKLYQGCLVMPVGIRQGARLCMEKRSRDPHSLGPTPLPCQEVDSALTLQFGGSRN